ncbi:MAG: hypothetical protein NVS9B6_04040 [Candidatus Limnocylindrales bacterium]
MLGRSAVAILALSALVSFGPSSITSGGTVPQGTQSNSQYARSGGKVTAVTATTQRTSCYTPLVPYATSDGPNDGYTGETVCARASTGEDLGPYPTQAGANPGYPAGSPMLVKDHAESDLRVDPTDPKHLIGTSKWIVSAEGYNHLLGFFESFDGGKTWPVQGHIPGYEGWTDNTDPVGAFDRYGNFYSLNLPYQFFYNPDGTHNFSINPNQEPNPSQPAEAITVSVRPHGAKGATDWLATHNGQPDIVTPYDSKGNEPDKQWIAIDRDPLSPFVDRVYAMWVDFTGYTPHAMVSWAQALSDGTHTDWSAPVSVPNGPDMPQGATYLLPHIAPGGTLWTTLTNGGPAHQFATDRIVIDRSNDGGVTWTTVGIVADNIAAPPYRYANTTFRDGILNSFAIGQTTIGGRYPLYVAWEEASAGVVNLQLAASYDDGVTWSSPIQVNDNDSPVDAFQPVLATAASGTVGVAFYDRRLACPSAGTAEAAAAGIGLDMVNPRYPATPPYGAANYCVNTSLQFYDATLTPKGHNVRLSPHTFDPQLNAPHSGCATCLTTFIGDYFGFDTIGNTAYLTFVTTYDDGTNPGHNQQQVVASVTIP